MLYSILPCYMIIFTILSNNPPFCSFGVSTSPGKTIRPMTNPPPRHVQPGNATWISTVAAVSRFSFFFESDRNRPFGRRFGKDGFFLDVGFWNRRIQKRRNAWSCFFLLRDFFFWSFLFFGMKRAATVNKCFRHFFGGQEIALASTPTISLRTVNETSIEQRAFFNASQEYSICQGSG